MIDMKQLPGLNKQYNESLKAYIFIIFQQYMTNPTD
jgi:hypothetical protein